MEELTSGDKKVVDLLSKLKSANGIYPPEIFSARRGAYLKQITNVGLGIGIGAGLKNVTKSSNGAGTVVTTVTSKILEIALVTAIAVEAGTVAYLYRGKITDFIKSHISPTSVQEVAPSTNNNSSNNSRVGEATTTPWATATEISTYTPVPPLFINNNNQSTNNNGGGSNPNANATPKPGGDNGNHYGQTPKPERTKENNGGGNGNNNKP